MLLPVVRSYSSELGERKGITLIWQVRNSEKGQFLTLNSKPLQVRSLEEELRRTLVRQVWSSEKGQFLSPNSEPWQIRSSEKEPGPTLVRQVRSWRKASSFLRTPNLQGFGVRRKDRAKPWFCRFGVRRKDRAKPWFGSVGVWRKTGFFL